MKYEDYAYYRFGKNLFFKIKHNIFDMLSKEQLVYDDEFN